MAPRFSPALRIAASTVLLVVLLPAIIEAIYVSPTAVFMDERSDAAQVTIGNSGDTPEEATVELQFGFPDVDSAGTPFVRMIDDPGPEFPSAADWIRAFPQRVRLEPKSQQVVRLLARPPANLPDGEYWTRLIVTGRGASLRVAGADSVVRAGVNLVIRLVASVTYRKGKVSTGVAVRDLAAEAEGDSLTLWAHLDRQGNAAYLGTADVELVNGGGVDRAPLVHRVGRVLPDAASLLLPARLGGARRLPRPFPAPRRASGPARRSRAARRHRDRLGGGARWLRRSMRAAPPRSPATAERHGARRVRRWRWPARCSLGLAEPALAQFALPARRSSNMTAPGGTPRTSTR